MGTKQAYSSGHLRQESHSTARPRRLSGQREATPRPPHAPGRPWDSEDKNSHFTLHKVDAPRSHSGKIAQVGRLPQLLPRSPPLLQLIQWGAKTSNCLQILLRQGYNLFRKPSSAEHTGVKKKKKRAKENKNLSSYSGLTHYLACAPGVCLCYPV